MHSGNAPPRFERWANRWFKRCAGECFWACVAAAAALALLCLFVLAVEAGGDARQLRAVITSPINVLRFAALATLLALLCYIVRAAAQADAAPAPSPSGGPAPTPPDALDDHPDPLTAAR